MALAIIKRNPVTTLYRGGKNLVSTTSSNVGCKQGGRGEIPGWRRLGLDPRGCCAIPTNCGRRRRRASRKPRKILLPHGVAPNEVRPIRIERRARLVNAIARGRRWLDEIVSGAATDVQQIATREKCSVRHVNMTISLAFLAPDLVRATVEGRLPRGVGVERLREAPAEWSRQFQVLGLNPG
jgi:hypothetical protein